METETKLCDYCGLPLECGKENAYVMNITDVESKKRYAFCKPLCMANYCEAAFSMNNSIDIEEE